MEEKMGKKGEIQGKTGWEEIGVARKEILNEKKGEEYNIGNGKASNHNR
jgi:hypothetical protein